jgi:hypothetical protein
MSRYVLLMFRVQMATYIKLLHFKRKNSGVSVKVLFEHFKRNKLEEPDGVFFADL